MSDGNVNNIFSTNYNPQQYWDRTKDAQVKAGLADAALSKKINKDTLEKTGCSDGMNDGKISFKEKVKNFAKGIISPITTIFKSPKNFVIGLGAIGGTAVLIAATGGAIAPFLVAAGVIGGGIQIVKNTNNARKATTDVQAKQAWQGIGSGTTAVASSIIGAKGALKATGVDTSKMNIIKATIECIKRVPASIKNSVNAFKTGAFISNLKSVFKTKNESPKKIQKEAKARTDAEIASKRNAEISQEAYKQRHEKNLSNKSAEDSAQTFIKDEQIKAEAKARTDAEIVSKRNAEISQEAYKQRHEKNLSNKSAEDSAQTFIKDEQIKAEAKARTDAEIVSKRNAEISQEAYKQRHEKNLSNKSAEDSAQTFIKDEQIKAEAKARTDAEIVSKRNAEISQEAYKQRHEKNLSNKSAEDSAQTFIKDEQIKANEQNTAQPIQTLDELSNDPTVARLQEQLKQMKKVAEEGKKISDKTPETRDYAEKLLKKSQEQIEAIQQGNPSSQKTKGFWSRIFK